MVKQYGSCFVLERVDLQVHEAAAEAPMLLVGVRMLDKQRKDPRGADSREIGADI